MDDGADPRRRRLVAVVRTGPRPATAAILGGGRSEYEWGWSFKTGGRELLADRLDLDPASADLFELVGDDVFKQAGAKLWARVGD